ncbi:FkbM family methyltransferase [Tianweitania sediminis]|uniref:FkbM family methyltransferase n=1 Tax=Tianweitania sediminis TaxID=1502156 RepID=A0A8J7RHK4_9HYPH|nr:FkbM family methyltransferase [Tianweitania sediminis]MBP0438581.1 FkbM family methyltransferase [Tianweitania sediminis]
MSAVAAVPQTAVHPLRRLAEYALRNLVVRRRLPPEFGRRLIFLSPANRLRALQFNVERFEPELLGYVRRFVRSGMTVWDIGANMGSFAFPAAHAVGSTGAVLAIEPDPFNQMLLHRSLAANPDLSVTIVPAAVSDRLALSALEIAARGRAANSLRGADHGSQMGGTRTTYPVVTVTLDWLAEQQPAPDLIKCDAEGAEVWILTGGTELLREKRPLLIMEVPRENSSVVTRLLHEQRYAIFAANRPISASAALPAIGDSWEIVAVPEERVDHWNGA